MTKGNLTLPVTFPPSVTNVSHNSKWDKCEIENAGIHSFGGTFAQLVGRFGTDRTLS